MKQEDRQNYEKVKETLLSRFNYTQTDYEKHLESMFPKESNNFWNMFQIYKDFSKHGKSSGIEETYSPKRPDNNK